jgi:hypothetical protein
MFDMKRRVVFIPSILYSKDTPKCVVESINDYFNKGYDIEYMLNVDYGYYLFLVLKDGENVYSKKHLKYDLIEENNHKWVKTSTGDIVFNTSTGDKLLN